MSRKQISAATALLCFLGMLALILPKDGIAWMLSLVLIPLGYLVDWKLVRCPHCKKPLGKSIGAPCKHCGKVVDWDSKL